MRGRRPKLGIKRLVLAGLVGGPLAAQAHLPLSGSSDLLNGVLHPFVTPGHVLVLLASGLFVGQRLRERFGTAFIVFPIASAIALALTPLVWTAGITPPSFLAIGLILGLLVASDIRIPALVVGVFVALAGGLIGLDSRPEIQPPATDISLLTLFGTWIGLNVVFANLAYYAMLMATQGATWLVIALRVIGSWIVAISVLMLAFALRK